MGLDDMYVMSILRLQSKVSNMLATSSSGGSSGSSAADFIGDIGNAPAGGGVFNGLTNTVGDVSKSGYQLAMKIGAAGVVICLILVGTSFVFNGSGSKTEQNKSWLGRIAIGGVFVFGAIAIANFIASMSTSIGTSLGN